MFSQSCHTCRAAAVYVAIAVISAMAPIATADEVRPAYLEISEANSGVFEVLWKQPIVGNKRLPIQPLFPTDCEMQEQGPPQFTASALLQRWQTTCELTDKQVSIDGLSASLTDVFVRVTNAGREPQTYILRASNPMLAFAETHAGEVGYIEIGIEHLLSGIDHVLFVVGLVLFIRKPWPLFTTVTAFTAAHSITLALATLGWVSLKQAPVEAIIALSIVFLARELAKPEKDRSPFTRAQPWVMAFGFGLLHGLGFAGALGEVGLPEDAVFWSLLLFNVGVEIGQLIIIAIFACFVWLSVRIARLAAFNETAIFRGSAYVMGSLAMYWTIDRTILLF